MKKITSILFVLLLFGTYLHSQTWTAEQLLKANTAKDIEFLSQLEKDAIMYVNLARLYPKEFLEIELKKYTSPTGYQENLDKSSYKRSLKNLLQNMQPVGVLAFDSALYESAKCLAEEQSRNGSIGHKRIKCKEAFFAECCSYGMMNGLDVAMQWLIDDRVPGNGHRLLCLSKNYTKIGLCSKSHPQWKICTVANMK